MTEPSLDPQPEKSLFRNGFKKKQLRKREEDGDDHDGGASQAILSTKKKRKLLDSLSFKRGLDVKDALKVTYQPTEDVALTIEVDATKDPDRVRAFSGSSCKNTASDGVLEQKHKAAMEDFIKKNLKTDEETQQHASNKDKPMDLESKLYEDLQSVAQRLSGVADTTNEQTEEGDVGAGGAMLGGTGIAEVILPVESRIATARETEEATTRMRKGKQEQREMPTAEAHTPTLPMSFCIGAGKRSRRQRSIEATQGNKRGNKSSVITTAIQPMVKQDLPSSYNHNFKLHSEERRNQLHVAQDKTTEKFNEKEDADRMGFAASRRFTKGEQPGAGGEKVHYAQGGKQSNDARVFRDFVKHQRERGF